MLFDLAAKRIAIKSIGVRTVHDDLNVALRCQTDPIIQFDLDPVRVDVSNQIHNLILLERDLVAVFRPESVQRTAIGRYFGLQVVPGGRLMVAGQVVYFVVVIFNGLIEMCR